jgi:hypothetical protein
MPNHEIRLGETVAARATFSLEREEHADERAARLVKEERDHVAETRWKHIYRSAILLALFAVAIVAGYEGVWDAAATPETKRWAQTVLSALFTGAVGFVFGQVSAKSK